ncbi:MAG: hypothetical protein CVU65_16635 [Deltaproteobacteria bacterium HGW-Deltaproteobacteria-22]|jgi:hypothetical protein|nr:MAG: hypothetical protein CVU65_16635 [Deltaproteobacteria bacterium HGW-Deltaproteobacteria-22]
MSCRLPFIFFFGCLLGLPACDDGSGKSTNNVNNINNVSNTNNANNACGAPGDASPRFGQTSNRFDFRNGPGWRVLSGHVDDGPPPDPFTEAGRQGLCRLLTSAPTFCDPACEWGTEVCIDSTCRTYPGVLSAGAFTLTGATGAPVTIHPDNLGYYVWDSTEAFTVENIGLAAAGDLVGAFTLEACAPPQFAPVGDWSALMEARAPGADVTLTWSAPAPGARVYLRMTTGVGTHGGVSPVEIECEGPDAGQLTLPGDYLDQLYAEGWACGECGDNTLRRYYADEADVAGTLVQLRVSAETTFWFRP